MTRSPKIFQWKWSPGSHLTLDRPVLMGILNVTPDSFSDGGRYVKPDDALARADEMQRQGAELIDVGGESTRPGARRISTQEQIDRVVPSIEKICSRLSLPVSIDTTDAKVAQAALDVGASIVNDVSAGFDDEDMFSLVAQRQCGLILMHRRVAPQDDAYSTEYESEPDYVDVVGDVGRFLLGRAEMAMADGVDASSIMLDPGLGFGKSVAQNWHLIQASDRLCGLGYPVLGAASRKSFLTAICGSDVPPADRGAASVAASILQYKGGCRLFRVHDVGLHAIGLAGAARVGESAGGPAMM